MCDIADGQNDVESSGMRRARKPHACVGCPEPILPGDTYVVTRVLYDGAWDGWKHCLRCHALYTALLAKASEVYDDIAIAPSLDCGSSWEHAWGEAPPPEVADLAFAVPADFAVETTP